MQKVKNRLRRLFKEGYVGKVQNIPIILHWSIAIPFAVSIFFGKFENVGWLFVLYTCVLLHELGHCLAALMYKSTTEKILMTAIGGIAQIRGLQYSPPKEEFVITACGPLVNLVIIGIILLPMRIFGWTSEIAMTIIAINLILFLFNVLIPAWPMDGGRLLRSSLAMVLDYNLATKIASYTAIVIAIGLGTWATLNGYIMAPFIAIMIGFSAYKELKRVKHVEKWKKRNSHINI